jgi:hypothetical protein
MKPRYSKICLLIEIMLLVIFSLAGCTRTVSSTQILTPVTTQQLQTRTSTLQVSMTPTSTTRPRTATPTIIPTATTQPTLSVEEARTLLFELLQDNGGCQLPCLWGQTPGKTDTRSLDTFFAHFGEISIDNDFYINTRNSSNGRYTHAAFILWKSDTDAFLVSFLDFTYQRTDDEMNLFELYAEASRRSGEPPNDTANPSYGDSFFDQLLQNYMLQQILSNYGQPTQVVVMPYYDNPLNDPDFIIPFSLSLFYADQGIFVEYLFPRETVGDHYVGCPWKAAYIILQVWSPESHPSLSEIIQGNSVGINSLMFTKSIEESTSMTLEQFYQRFKDPNNTSCLETPIDLWTLP